MRVAGAGTPHLFGSPADEFGFVNEEQTLEVGVQGQQLLAQLLLRIHVQILEQVWRVKITNE